MDQIQGAELGAWQVQGNSMHRIESSMAGERGKGEFVLLSWRL
jgi:hypothetical protein